MNINKIVHFFIDHNDTIIEWSTVVILLLVIAWTVVNYFIKDDVDSNVNIGQLDQLEETLKKILEKGVAVGAPTAQSVSASQIQSDSSGVAASSEELDKLKVEIADREKTINDLKAELEKAKASSDDNDLKEKIQALEDRLAEYEIIEDDIADLSTYKEENAKLKVELAKLRGDGTVSTEEIEQNIEDEAIEEALAAEENVRADEEDSADEVAKEDVSPKVEELLADDERQEESGESLDDSLLESKDNLKDTDSSFEDDGDDLVNEFESAMGGGLGDEISSESEAEESKVDVEAATEEVRPEDEARSEEARSEDSDEEADVNDLLASIEEEPLEEQELESGQAAVKEDLVAAVELSNDVGQDDIFGEFVSNEGEEPITSSVIDEITSNVTKPKEGAAAGPEASLESLVEELNNESSKEAASGEELGPTIDTDKMLNEMVELSEMDEGEVESALEEEMDVDKMAAEASKLSTEN